MKKLLVDCDGVVSNFVLEVANTFRLPPTFQPSGWEIWSDCKVSETAFWETIRAMGTDFWEWMEEYETASIFMKSLKSVCPNIFLCSSPVKDEAAYAGRAAWSLHTSFEHSGLLLVDAKSKFADKDTMLIDDKVKACKSFVTAGGEAVIYPRPWNGSVMTDDEGWRFVVARAMEFCQVPGSQVRLF